MNSIIELSGSGKSGFYRLYKNKEEIYFALVDEINRISVEYELFDFSKEFNLFDFFRIRRELVNKFKAIDIRLYNFLSMLSKETNKVVYEKVLKTDEQQGKAMLEASLKKLSEEGKIRTDIGIDIMVLYVYGMLSAQGLPWTGLAVSNEEADQCIKLLKSSLGYKE